MQTPNNEPTISLLLFTYVGNAKFGHREEGRDQSSSVERGKIKGSMKGRPGRAGEGLQGARPINMQ